MISRGTHVSMLLLSVGLVFTASPLWGQRSTALVGAPFGVAQVTIPIDVADWGPVGASVFRIEERDGRALYPVFTRGRIRSRIGDLLLGSDRPTPNAITALFLFTGTEPLQLTLHMPDQRKLVLNPREGRQIERNVVLQRWWREYESAARQQVNEGDYPAIVQTYLTSMLARRMGLEKPLLSRLSEEGTSEWMQTFEMLLGMESLRRSRLEATMRMPDVAVEAAEYALPAAVDWQALETKWKQDVQVEPLAFHVPQDCFYVRFGSFKNYLWLDQLTNEFGGDIGQMVTARGHQQNLTKRVQQQLGLRLTEVARLLGDTIISDVALIGRDTMVREGAALGMLFEARNNAVLLANFQTERRAAAKAAEKLGATVTQVELAGVTGSLLASPDNRVRSFYVVIDKYHLFTTSRAIAESFVRAKAEGRGLGMLDEFKHARTQMPLAREDTIFAYFSIPFFHGLVSPHYQVELGRRMRAVTDMELVALAKLAAHAERRPGTTIRELVDAELLPEAFLQRVDGSRVVQQGSRLLDSARGARGYFTPIPDMLLEAISASELRACQEKAEHYAAEWKRLDPVMVGIKRFALNKEGLERVTVDATVSPLEESKYGRFLSMLGPNTPQRVSVPDDAVISVQAVVKGGSLSPQVPPHLLFLGVLDQPPKFDVKPDGLLQTLQFLKATPGYLGSWPKAGFLDMLGVDLDGEPDAFGFSQAALGLWRRQLPSGFSVLSYDRELLGSVTDRLQIEEGDEHAQLRVHVGDLSQSKVKPLINNLFFGRAYDVSVANAQLMHVLAQQMGLPLSESRQVAEMLFDTKLVCSLGGEYELVEDDRGGQAWQSTAWGKPSTTAAAADYDAPMMSWLRQLDATLMKDGDQLRLRASIDMQRKEPEQSFELPLFGIFGTGKQTREKTPPQQVERLPEPGSSKPRGQEF